MLRKKGVVGKFVEFFGAGLADLPLADRATIANMAPEYGATCGIFPSTPRRCATCASPAGPRSWSSWSRPTPRNRACSTPPNTPEAVYSDTLELDLATVEPSLAGPKRPQDRVRLGDVKKSFAAALPGLLSTAKAKPANSQVDWPSPRRSPKLRRSEPSPATPTARTRRPRNCITARSSSRPSPAAPTPRNPSVMLAAGLLAKKAVEKGLQTQAVGQDQPGARLEGRDRLPDRGRPDARTLEQLRLPPRRLRLHDLHRQQRTLAGRVSRGHRRRQPGRGGGAERQPQLRRPRPSRGAGQLPRLAAAGGRLRPGRPHGHRPARPSRSAPDTDGKPVYLKDVWPTQQEVQDAVGKSVHSEMFTKEYGEVFKGDEHWQSLPVPEGDLFRWDADSPPTSSIRPTSRT